MHITTEKAKEIIRVTILTRAGAVITPELAEERARNCVAALSGCTIGKQPTPADVEIKPPPPRCDLVVFPERDKHEDDPLYWEAAAFHDDCGDR